MESFLNSANSVFDGVLALALLILAWRLLRSPELFNAIVLFISFGLIMGPFKGCRHCFGGGGNWCRGDQCPVLNRADQIAEPQLKQPKTRR
jgi:hypothetical protein